MKSLISRSLAACLLLVALITPALADESHRGFYEASLNGGGRVVLFVSSNVSASAFVFDPASAQASEGTAAINKDGTFSINLANGKTLSGTIAKDNVTVTYNGQTVTASRVSSFGHSDSIAGLFTGTATSTAGTLTNANFVIDSQGNIFFIAQQNGNVIGGVGTITINQQGGGDDSDDNDEDGDKSATGTFTLTMVNGATVNGTFMFNHGKFSATFTLNGVQYTFTAGRDSLNNRLANISTRGFVNTGQGQLIGGVILHGGPKLVLIRAIGPTLSDFGGSPVLTNPKLQLFQNGKMLAQNDDWQTNSNASDISATGLAPKNSNEAALLMRLEPGAYTTVVTGSDGGTGIALVEVYDSDRD